MITGKIVSAKGLLPDSAKQMHETRLIYRQLDPEKHMSMKFNNSYK